MLIALVAILALGMAANRIFGRDLGESCPDSWACRRFLGGGECVEEEGRSYCSVYCGADADCPRGWRCGDANPTVLTVETSAVARVCVAPEARAH